VFDSNEVLEAKLWPATPVTTSWCRRPFVARQIQAGMFQRLNKNKLANYKNLDPEIMATLATYDPDNAHACPTCGAPPASATTSPRSRNA
jgi:putrescine transport system substrate-binding protein